MISQRFFILPGEWSLARLAPDAHLPAWAMAPALFTSISRTAQELSIVCPSSIVPPDVRSEHGWALLKLHGPLAFTETGVLASFAAPLAEAGIPLFVVSTFDTDYVLVKTATLDGAVRALAEAGHVRE